MRGLVAAGSGALAAVWLLAGCGLVLSGTGESHPLASSPAGSVPAPPAPSLPETGCTIFPADNYWNTPVADLPVLSNSDRYIQAIGADSGLHADFGSGSWDGGPIGIPYNLADPDTPRYAVEFYYPEESDPGPYPIPNDARIEWGSDHHLLVLESGECKLYELYDAWFDDGWRAGSGAVWDLTDNALRPDGWTSADAAGLPILAGLVRYEEAASGAIRHALRFTAHATSQTPIWPARHQASDSNAADLPPMGLRVRLKADFDISGYPAEVRVILTALQVYGMVLADNGADWYINGAPDARWDNEALHLLGSIPGSAFEAVDTSLLMVDPDSAAARLP